MAIGVWEILGLGLNYCGVTLAYVIFLYFVNRLYQIRKTTREILPIIGVMFLFFCGGTAFLVIGWFDYFRWTGVAIEEIFILFKIYAAFFFSSLGFISFLMEYVVKKTKYILTLYVVGSMLVVLIAPTMADANFLSLILSLPMFVLSAFLWYFVFIRNNSGYLRIHMVIAYIGVFLVGSGLFVRNDSFIQFLGMPIYVIGTLIGILGVSLIWYGFSALSTFTDLRWKEKMRELFIISPKGVSLYAFSFETNQPLEDTDLIAGGFSGIQTLLSEMVRTDQNLQLIDYRDLKIMLEQGEHAIFILILNEESSFLHYKLELFCRDFQAFFKEALQNWMGETGLFHPTKTLIQRVFEIDEMVA